MASEVGGKRGKYVATFGKILYVCRQRLQPLLQMVYSTRSSCAVGGPSLRKRLYTGWLYERRWYNTMSVFHLLLASLVFVRQPIIIVGAGTARTLFVHIGVNMWHKLYSFEALQQ